MSNEGETLCEGMSVSVTASCSETVAAGGKFTKNDFNVSLHFKSEAQSSKISSEAINSSEGRRDCGRITKSIPFENGIRIDEDGVVEPSVLQKANGIQHSPFSWQEDLNINNYGDHPDIDLLADVEKIPEKTKFELRRFIAHLVTGYHKFFKRLMNDTIENLDKMDEMLRQTASGTSADPLFNAIEVALTHVSQSVRFYIFASTNQSEKANKILEKITPYKSMNETNKAGIWGIRAVVYGEYGYEGVKKAVEFANKAAQLDGKNAYWYFYKGVYLSRLRHMRNDASPSDEELKCFLTSIRKCQNPEFYAFTGEIYEETAKTIEKLLNMHGCPEDTKEALSCRLHECSERAVEFFRRSLELQKLNSARLLFRCAKGFMLLPIPHKDLKLAKKLLEEGLHLSPESSYGNYVMSMFTMEFEKDSEVTIQYLQKAVECRNFLAHMDLCRIRYMENGNPKDLVNELEGMLHLYDETPKQGRILGELICCYLFLKYDVVRACGHMQRLIGLQSSWINFIYEFNSGLFPFSRKIPLIELVFSEVGVRFQSENITEPEKNEYKKFYQFLFNEHVTLKDKEATNILHIYIKDLEQGFEKLGHSFTTKLRNDEEDKYSNDNRGGVFSRNTSDNEYQKFYHSQTKKNVCDVLPSSFSQKNEPDRSGRKEEHDETDSRVEGWLRMLETSGAGKLEKHSGECEKYEHVTKGISALVVDEAEDVIKKTNSTMQRGDNSREVSTSEKMAEKFARRTDDEQLTRYKRSARMVEHGDLLQKADQNIDSNSSLERKSMRTAHSSSSSDRKSYRTSRKKELSRSPNPDRTSTRSYRRKKYRHSSPNSDGSSRGFKGEENPSSSSSSDRTSGKSNRFREGHRLSSSPNDKFVHASRKNNAFRSPSPDRVSMRSSRSSKYRHPSSSSNRKSRRNNRKKSRSRSSGRISRKSNQNSEFARSSSSPDSVSVHSRRQKKSARSPNIDRKSLRSHRSRKYRRSSSSSDRESRSSMSSSSQDRKCIKSNKIRKDSPHHRFSSSPDCKFVRSSRRENTARGPSPDRTSTRSYRKKKYRNLSSSSDEALRTSSREASPARSSAKSKAIRRNRYSSCSSDRKNSGRAYRKTEEDLSPDRKSTGSRHHRYSERDDSCESKRSRRRRNHSRRRSSSEDESHLTHGRRNSSRRRRRRSLEKLR